MTTSENTMEVLSALERLIEVASDFVTAWGDAEPAMLEQLERFAGYQLPTDFKAFALRFGNALIGYTPVWGLGPVSGRPAAQTLTEERRDEWPSMPPDCLALGEVNTDLIVLSRDGAVEFRTESSRDLTVFKTFPSFTAFLRYAIDWAVDEAKLQGKLPQSFDPWQFRG